MSGIQIQVYKRSERASTKIVLTWITLPVEPVDLVDLGADRVQDGLAVHRTAQYTFLRSVEDFADFYQYFVNFSVIVIFFKLY